MSKTAICIGINDYPGTGSDLSGCVNDANDWAAELARHGFTVSKLLDSQATKAAMTAAIRDAITAARNGDTLVFTYSGHGTWVPDRSGDEPDGRDEALCPYDLTTKGALIDDEIRVLFDARAQGVRILLISDSCHSGTVTRDAGNPLVTSDARARFLPLEAWMPAGDLPPADLPADGSPRRATSGRRRTGGDLLLAGCLDTEYSWDTSFQGRPNGAFTYYALKTLRERKPANYDAWFKAIGDYLPTSALTQHPQILGADTARAFGVFA